ncbi:MAG: class I tRNA ligase family protein, partial [Dehalococcoidales bacterium]
PPDWGGEELEEAYIEAGSMVNSGRFSGLPSEPGMDAVSDLLKEKGWGGRTVTYKLRDWLISRQRYWGAPIPIIYCPNCGIVPVPEHDLPVVLPEDAEFKPTGESPLKYNEQFVNTTCPKCGGPAKRETDTMDTFMCSSWYFLRYASPGFDSAPFDADKLGYWMPVDLYTGGAEHAVMHLLYARFFAKALRDMGLTSFGEPFSRLFNQGIIVADKQKMSKSRGNVITPDEYVSQLGADAMRAYLMFVAPWQQGGEWNDSGIIGMSRWLNRVWRLVLGGYKEKPSEMVMKRLRSERVDIEQASRELARITHQTIRKVTQDLEKMRFNTMIAALMEFTNYLAGVRDVGFVIERDWRQAIKTLLLLLAPTAPHIAEELWHRTGGDYSIHNQGWPGWDEELAKDEEITLVVQVNGRLRDRVTVPQAITEAEARQIALDSLRVRSYLEGKEIARMVYVPKKLINLVVK